ncbi:hypothetical protein Tco_0965613 [Tanacetum coccineum]
MANLTFADSHNMVAYLEKSEASDDFAEIVDFLNASSIRYALTSGGPTTLVADETVHEERGDSVERAATTATSLDAKQGSGNINRTQSTAIPNDPFPQGTGSGGSPRHQDTILGDRPAQTRIESSAEKSLGDQDDASKQGRNEIDQDEEISWFQEDAETQGRYGHNVSAASPTRPVDDSTTNDITLAETLMKIKSSASRLQKDKGVMKGIMQEPEKPVKVKGKDQIEYDVDVAQRLQAELDEGARLEREREEEASNVALIKEWDSIEATIDADRQLAKQLQARLSRSRSHLASFLSLQDRDHQFEIAFVVFKLGVFLSLSSLSVVNVCSFMLRELDFELCHCLYRLCTFCDLVSFTNMLILLHYVESFKSELAEVFVLSILSFLG